MTCIEKIRKKTQIMRDHKGESFEAITLKDLEPIIKKECEKNE